MLPVLRRAVPLARSFAYVHPARVLARSAPACCVHRSRDCQRTAHVAACSTDAKAANPRVFFDVKIGDKKAGRVVMEVRCAQAFAARAHGAAAAQGRGTQNGRELPRALHWCGQLGPLSVGVPMRATSARAGEKSAPGAPLHYKGSTFHRVIPGCAEDRHCC